MAVYKSRLVPVGKPAPAFSLRQLGGGRASTSSLRGHVVLLSFWTASCPPCHAEAPHLQRLHDTYRKRGVRIVGVTPLTPLEEIHGFVARHGLTYPIAVDPGENVVRRYGLRGYPALVLLDRRGVVRWTHPGYKTGDERTVERKIAALLQG
jgi:peroxiredoxin